MATPPLLKVRPERGVLDEDLVILLVVVPCVVAPPVNCQCDFVDLMAPFPERERRLPYVSSL